MERSEILTLLMALFIFGVDLLFLYKAFKTEVEKHLVATTALLGINLIIALILVIICNI